MLETFHNSQRILNRQSYSKQSGMTLVMALFIIIVLGLLASFLYQMTQTANSATAQEVLSIRAFYAAESGAQAAAMQAFPLTGGGACNNQTINFSAPGLINCSSQVTCNSYTADGLDFYSVVSTGRCGSGENQTSRTIEVLLKTPN
ncbi:PilX N-terminal domain-containing pilus assembly protein [Pleionea litopenaei]|uniref:Type 4 fimbrial biogenesis protein PilX N-terminal domain-containing protein n=1 Tax=Pleionea litopenaei TaxID=3070815 RepID=A0AA51RR52_9GAMM|nr:hypothetical protein [Pleionea sp. HL-JVS1]WMS85939.1 hypothetical protein Q9312_11995 [Pleionea sp. HL-JVS1]